MGNKNKNKVKHSKRVGKRRANRVEETKNSSKTPLNPNTPSASTLNSSYKRQELETFRQNCDAIFSEDEMNGKIDMHVHIKDNSDGVYSPEKVIRIARANGVKILGFLQHNCLEGWIKFAEENNLKKFASIHHLDGMALIPSVEITCRDSGCLSASGKPLKVHIIGAGVNLNENSPLVRLMRIKNENDKMVDYGLVHYIAKLKNVEVTDSEIQQYILNKRKTTEGFNTMGREDVIKFFENRGVEIAKSKKGLKEILDKAPKIDRLNLELDDVVRAISLSGGVAILAHPSVNLHRSQTPDLLLKDFILAGGLFTERATNFYEQDIVNVINQTVRQNPGLFYYDGGGSDTHVVDGNMTIGRTKYGPMYTKNFMAVLSKLAENQSYREKGILNYYGNFRKEFDRMNKTIENYMQTAEALKKPWLEKSEQAFLDSLIKDDLTEYGKEQEQQRRKQERLGIRTSKDPQYIKEYDIVAEEVSANNDLVEMREILDVDNNASNNAEFVFKPEEVNNTIEESVEEVDSTKESQEENVEDATLDDTEENTSSNNNKPTSGDDDVM